ncbi:g8920 [Coccomyxa elongata]
MGRGGQKVAADEDLSSNPAYAPFCGEHFDAMEFASHSLSTSSTTAQAKTIQLQEGIKALHERIRQEVERRQDDLLQQAESLREAQSFMQGINLSVDSLQAAMRRVRAEVMQPYTSIRMQTSQLHNLHTTADTLRHVLHRLKLLSRLKAQMASSQDKAGSQEPAKAAKLLSDITAVGQEIDLSGLNVVEADEEYLQNASYQVHVQAKAALRAGMETLSQAEVGSALQIYFNLNELPQAVTELVESSVSQVERQLTSALDARRLTSAGAAAGGFLGGPGGRGSPAPGTAGSTAKLAEILWQNLSKALDTLHGAAVAVWHLQRVLAKKRDPLSHVLFSDSLQAASCPSPLSRFWELATGALQNAFADAAAVGRAGLVRELLTAQYPRLARIFEDTLAKLLQDTEVKGAEAVLTEDETEAVVAAVAPFQQAYLGTCLMRMSDAATSAFPGGNRSLPTSAELQKFIGRMHEELKGVGASTRLAAQVAACVGKALRVLAEKAEYMAATGPDVRQVGGACTSAQLRNITLCCQLNEVHRSLVSLLPRLPAHAAAAIKAPLEAVQSVAVEAVMPLFRAAVDAAEQAVLRMHSHDFGAASAPSVAGASPYMADLTRHIALCRVEYLSKFSPPPSSSTASFGGALTERMAGRILLFFMRHASLLRPLSQAGKLQLAKDIAELEAAVAENLLPLEAVGAPHRALRAFRALLFAPTPALADSLLLPALPRSTVLHHLYSRAPPALQSPHSRSGFSPAQYSMWLDQHSMEEALKFIRTALEACAPAARDQPGFDDVYPLMLKLCSP